MTVNKSLSEASNDSYVWLPWTLSTLVSAIAIYAWGSNYGWSFSTLSSYTVFPVLGLVAFSIMWSHYMAGEMKRLFMPATDLKTYFSWTGYAVLVLIVLHPGLLIYQRFRDGYGLPPKSYESYVAPGMAWLTLLGSASLLVFLAFELKRWFEKKQWWQYFLVLNDAAMLAVFYHGLRLGGQLQTGWFRYVWLLYGITLIAVLIHKYVLRFQQQPAQRS